MLTVINLCYKFKIQDKINDFAVKSKDFHKSTATYYYF